MVGVTSARLLMRLDGGGRRNVTLLDQPALDAHHAQRPGEQERVRQCAVRRSSLETSTAARTKLTVIARWFRWCLIGSLSS